MTVQDVLADAVLACKGLSTRFLAGFTDGNRAAQADHLPNHLIWTLGHVALYINDAAGRLDGKPMPSSDFGPDLGAGQSRYANDSIGFGSRPVSDPSRYPTLARGVQTYEAACDRLAAAVRRANEATLGKKVDWLGTQIPLAQLVSRVMFHAGVHTGQIMDLRRALGLEPVLRP